LRSSLGYVPQPCSALPLASSAAIGIAGMVLIAIGSTTYMLLGRHLAETDPSSLSRTLQGFLSGIGFLGGAVIFKSGFDVKGIKAAAAVWITGALGLAIGTSYWGLGIVVGIVTAAVLFVADSFPDEVRESKQEPADLKSFPPGRGIGRADRPTTDVGGKSVLSKATGGWLAKAMVTMKA
jgi:putative Mg2+ transporter-C (MgtC) family protein